MPAVDTGASPKWPPVLAGLADPFGHHLCCLKVSPAPGVVPTHQSIHHSCSWAFQSATMGSNPAYKHILRKYSQAATGKQMPPTKGTLLEHLTLVTKDHVTGTSHTIQSHSLKTRRHSWSTQYVGKNTKLGKMKKQRNMF